MEKNLVYTTCGTCSKLLDVTVENDRVKRVQFIGGCHGNSQGTSCPDQLAKALTQLKNSR